jgi:hypothetical protein
MLICSRFEQRGLYGPDISFFDLARSLLDPFAKHVQGDSPEPATIQPWIALRQSAGQRVQSAKSAHMTAAVAQRHCSVVSTLLYGPLSLVLPAIFSTLIASLQAKHVFSNRLCSWFRKDARGPSEPTAQYRLPHIAHR